MKETYQHSTPEDQCTSSQKTNASTDGSLPEQTGFRINFAYLTFVKRGWRYATVIWPQIPQSGDLISASWDHTMYYRVVRVIHNLAERTIHVVAVYSGENENIGKELQDEIAFYVNDRNAPIPKF